MAPVPANDPAQYVTVEVEVDDSVPLPIPAKVEPGEDGDRVVEPASGNPHFLGFTAGRHYPPADERVDPELAASLRSHYADGRPTQEAYAFVMFERRITAERLEQLRALGVRVLEFHPHYSMKVALAPELVDAVAALDFVRWVGSPRRWQKVHRGMGDALAALRPVERLDAWISVYDSDLCADSSWRPAGEVAEGGPSGERAASDSGFGPRIWSSNGWQQRELERLGVEVREYVDSIRAFRVQLAPGQIELLTELDFVQFLEPHGQPRPAHDESMAMVLADYTRRFWDGAAPAVSGQVDSGIEYSHLGINGYFWVGSNLTGGGEATTDDLCGHGTHVAGTIHGSGAVEDSYEGAADLLGNSAATRFFNVKHFSGTFCSWSGASISTVLGALDSQYVDGNGVITPRPHAVNHSWGTDAPVGGAFGTEAACRTIDANVYTNLQLHVFAAGNEGPGASTVNIEASSKNAFTVGGVRDHALGAEDPGEMYTDSSRGPTADARWKPNISAPATAILSADADNLSGYEIRGGTSMATPHVTGVAAQLMERHSFLRHNPTTTGALLMASAMTKDNIVLSTPTATHLDNWGAGRLDAYKAHYGPGGVSFWGWTQGAGAGSYVDVPVNSGATRIAVCLYYHEVAASAGASTALVNDLDLWIDSPTNGIGATTNSGEYSAQQSSLDNTEIRLINNPVAGTWRVKVHPASVTSTCRVGIAVLVHYDDTTPDGTLTVTASKLAIQPGEDVNITATAYNPEYVASAVYFDSTSTGSTLVAATGVLEGGETASYMGNFSYGRDVLVGSIRPNDSRSVTWTARWGTEGLKNFSVEARSENWVNKTDLVAIVVDGTAPTLPTGLTSSTHPQAVWVGSNALSMSWTAAADALSGLAGYSWSLTPSPSTPDNVADILVPTSLATTLPGSFGSFYFNLRPVDRSGNWSTGAASYGPIRYDGVQPNYITGLTSPSNAVGSWSCDPNVTMTWNPMTDGGGSGVAGASFVWDHNPVTLPDATIDIGPLATTYITNLTPSSQPWYFHIRPYDNAGNGQNMFHYGPIYIAPSTTTYCTGKANSLGCVPAISSTGTTSKSYGNLTIHCSQALNQKTGLLFFGSASNSAPFQGGTLCVASPTIRTGTQGSGGSVSGNDCSGTYSFQFTTAVMTQYGLDPGDTVHCQYWMRDPASPSTTGLSNGLRFTVCD